MMWVWALAVLASCAASCHAAGCPSNNTDRTTSPDCYVLTTAHPVEGYKFTTYGGKTLCAYEGLPYAKAPKGELAFEPPEKLEYSDEVYYANETAPMCPQTGPYYKHVEGNIDCLRLSVYTPQVGNMTTKLPIVVYLHGGQYFFNTAADTDVASPYFLCDQDVILVTVNYRLGALGFFAAGDCALSGNWGLKDVAVAIQRIAINAIQFGGDPNKITLLGDGRGADIAQIMVYAEQTSGLINNVILGSGNIINAYAVAPVALVKDASYKLAEMCGCPTNTTSEQIKKCMQEVPYREIVANQLKVYPNPYVAGEYGALWAPIVEDATAPEAILNANPGPSAACCKPKYDILRGPTAYDGGYYTAYVLDPKSGIVDALNGPDRNTVLQDLLQLSFWFCKECLYSLTEEVDEYYLQGKNITADCEPQLTAMFTDWFYFVGARESALGHVGKQWFYVYNATFNVTFNDLRPSHLKLKPTREDILLSWFPMEKYFPNRTYSAQDLKIITFVTRVIANFANKDKPGRGLGVRWEPVDYNGSIQYLELTNDGAVLYDDFLPQGVKFWEYLFTKYTYKGDPVADYKKC